jgi:hypothetical protein
MKEQETQYQLLLKSRDRWRLITIGSVSVSAVLGTVCFLHIFVH